jgi:hypothetical protein
MATEYINKDGHEYVREENSFVTLRDDWFALIEPEFNAAEELDYSDIPPPSEDGTGGNEYWNRVYNTRNKWIMAELRKAGKIFSCEEDEDYIYVLND